MIPALDEEARLREVYNSPQFMQQGQGHKASSQSRIYCRTLVRRYVINAASPKSL